MYLRKILLAIISVSIPVQAMQKNVNLPNVSENTAIADKVESEVSNEEECQLFSRARAFMEKGNTIETIRLFKSSAALLKRLSSQGNDKAQFYLALVLQIEGQVSEAKELCERSAQLGNVQAQTYLGILFETEGNVSEAKRCFTLAAERGCCISQYRLGKLLEKADLLDDAKKFYKFAAEQGYSPARLQLGLILAKEGKTEEAEKLLQLVLTSGSRTEQEIALNHLTFILLQKAARLCV